MFASYLVRWGEDGKILSVNLIRCEVPEKSKAYEKNIGTYGRFKAEDGAVKWIDPRTDK